MTNISLSMQDKMVLDCFLKLNFEKLFLGQKEQCEMFSSYACMLFVADELMYDIHKYANPLKFFDKEKALNDSYISLKQRLSTQTVDYDEYFGLYETTIDLLSRLQKQFCKN